MTEHDVAFWSLIVAAVTGVVSVVAVLVAVRAKALASRQLEIQESAARQKPRLQCSLITLNSPDNILIAVPVVKDRVAEVELPVRVKNIGDKTAEHVTVYVRIPKELTYNNQISIGPMKSDWIKLKKFESAFVPEENFATIVFTVPRLPTVEHLILALPISIRMDSNHSTTFKARSKDDVPLEVDISFIVQYYITIFATCEGAAPFSKVHHIEVQDTSERSITEILNARNVAMRKKAAAARKQRTPMDVVLAAVTFFTSGDFKRETIQKFFVFCPANKAADPKYPIDRYPAEGSKTWEGARYLRDDTVFVPALGTTFFGKNS